MHPPISLFILIKLVIISTSLLKPIYTLPICRNGCGGITIDYPFGLDDGCGAPEYRNMLNCTGELLFQTPSGSYRVRSIDYDEKAVMIYDPGMSTCTTLQPRHDFSMSEIQSIVIPPSPDSIFALLNCSIDSPVLNHYRSLCFNFSGHSCEELYSGCTSFRLFHLAMGGYPPCCFTNYNTLKFMSMNILDCTHYTTMYNVDDLSGVGPLDWSYGIKLSYIVPNTGCDSCKRSGGTCGFNTETEGMLCMCSSFLNSTRQCGNAVGSRTAHGQAVINSTLLQVLVLVLRVFLIVIL
ncbi:wall-associated receptor kinase carboxy-terminal protein isoform X2 [Tasmannia lanceolata]|uniref:wall-associated receptor kinase carboxy-terminal protein isoform X2 n=1 Tax=Tasmannia lanceolata TaxID=3420 RepID=UPI004062DD22